MYRFFDNYVLSVAVYAWLAAQLLKTFINALISKKFHAERLIGAGGMPSSHSALVSALTVAMAKTTGISSPQFALSFLFACVVIYDAMGVRRSAGMHAKVLNKMVGTLNMKEQFDDEDDLFKKDLKEYIGHTPLEVLGGSLLGILVAMAISVS